MLGKLLKYEWKATARILGVIYLVVLACAGVFGLVSRTQIAQFGPVYEVMENSNAAGAASAGSASSGAIEIAIVIFGIVYVILIAAMFVVTAILIISRFYRNLLQGEGYLMHTLPVPTWMLVASKAISAILWVVLSYVTMMVSFLLLLVTAGVWTDETWRSVFGGIRRIFASVNLSGTLTVIVILAEIITFILEIYLCLAIGNIANRHKILVAVLAFIGIMIIEVILAGIFQNGVFSAMIGEGTATVTAENMETGLSGMINGAVLRQLVMEVVYGAASFFGTTAVLQKKLNLA